MAARRDGDLGLVRATDTNIRREAYHWPIRSIASGFNFFFRESTLSRRTMELCWCGPWLTLPKCLVSIGQLQSCAECTPRHIPLDQSCNFSEFFLPRAMSGRLGHRHSWALSGWNDPVSGEKRLFRALRFFWLALFCDPHTREPDSALLGVSLVRSSQQGYLKYDSRGLHGLPPKKTKYTSLESFKGLGDCSRKQTD